MRFPLWIAGIGAVDGLSIAISQLPDDTRDTAEFIVVGLLASAVLSLIWLAMQRRVRMRMVNEIARRDPQAIMVFGQLARTSPTPAIEAGFRPTLSGSHGHWNVALSFRARSFEIWAWDGRTPRRAIRAPLRCITALVGTDAHGREDLLSSLRMDWEANGARTWIELQPIDPHRLYRLRVHTETRDRLLVDLRRHIYEATRGDLRAVE